ncbi:MAG: HAD family hydrolase [Gammaproteobacteria bacterium]|nr:HAD family hydrolase [Gammaproteobacteria bacterium]
MLSTESIHTVILDMDGTMLDLNFDDQVWNFRLPEKLAELRQQALSECRHIVATTLSGRRGSLEWYCLDHWSREFQISLHAVEEELSDFIAIRPGTIEFLQFAQGAGYRLVLATNAHPASLARKMERTKIDRYFHRVVSAHELGEPKEAPEFWRRFAALEPFELSNSLFVDDNEAVLTSARASGINHLFGVLTPNSRGAPRVFRDFDSVDSLAELIPWFISRVRVAG